MNRVWTEEELEILRRDREAKVPVPVTAAKLGRPVPATYARARLIGTLVQPHQAWDDISVSRLRELVLTDPPMTDKRIAAELGRTVTQIRWKMQDLGLIGVRDLSKLAKATASASNRPKAAAKSEAPKRPVQKSTPAQPKAAAPVQVPAPVRASAPVTQAAPVQPDPQAALAQALKTLENGLKDRLKAMIAESEAGMVRAAMDAIAEKNRIDRELADRCKPAIKIETKASPEVPKAEAPQAKPAPQPLATAPKPVASVPKPKTEKPKTEKSKADAPKAAPKPALSKPLPAASRAVAPVAPSPAPAPAPKIVVMEAPAAIRSVEPEQVPAQTSGRGGWKSVRKDPARVAAQAKAKATNRADAVDLAQAAQAAIERFIAERGVTRTETGGIQALISRLQARGYIVVRDENGWLIDQRHRVENEAALVNFAEARGITLDIAA